MGRWGQRRVAWWDLLTKGRRPEEGVVIMSVKDGALASGWWRRVAWEVGKYYFVTDVEQGEGETGCGEIVMTGLFLRRADEVVDSF